MKILVLGHKGMLGRAVARYFSNNPKYEVLTTRVRFGDPALEETIQTLSPDAIINCIGKIPQKHPVENEYDNINIELPRFLESLGIRVIHPSTDCEFKGDLLAGQAYPKYTLRDAEDIYGRSKAVISEEIETSFTNTKIIRTSIIGHEESTSLSLLDWFLAQSGSVNGYTNHFWNGVTTLEWSKQCEKILNDWEQFPTLNQIGTTTHYSKLEVISLAKKVYEKEIEIIPFEHPESINRCLQSDVSLPELEEQLSELKIFFNK